MSVAIETEPSVSTPPTFQPLPLKGCPVGEQRKRMRVNCLGTLFYFIVTGLRRKRLTENLHKPLCQSLEKEHLKDVHEWPRDHFKSTCASEGLPIWRSLPVSPSDEDLLLKSGYSDEFVSWMHRIHKPEARNLLVSENITNSAKLGRRIAYHYESNPIFRHLFPEIIPTTAETWTNFSLHHRIPSGHPKGGHGEGTFDFLGVEGALQSRHYNGVIIEDDLVGRKAIESPSVMEKTIDYHKLVAGAFESEDPELDSSELVIGNRWGYTDLNSNIRENEPYFQFHTHGALGGCCPDHPMDLPIFPEEFSVKKLAGLRKRFGDYIFSCQYLNNPAAPENAEFKAEWLRYYSMEKDEKAGDYVIKHEVADGIVKKNVKTSHLAICLTSDPNHSGNTGLGRCRHAIDVVGLSADGDYYLLDYWAKASSYDEYTDKLYELADKWKLRKIGLETVAAQRYLAYHLDWRARVEGRVLKIVELKGEVDGPDGVPTHKKIWRISNVLSPIFEGGHFWIQRNSMDFYGEYTTFSRVRQPRYMDILDALAYAPQMLRVPQSYMDNLKWRSANAALARKVNQPYGIEMH